MFCETSARKEFYPSVSLSLSLFSVLEKKKRIDVDRVLCLNAEIIQFFASYFIIYTVVLEFDNISTVRVR